MRFFRHLLVTLGAASAVACSIGETNYEEVVLPARVRSEIRTCKSPFVKADLSKLKACGAEDGRGKGHCFDAGKVPFPAAELDACEGSEVCVPDKLLLANGSKAKACTFFMGDKPGACISLRAKQAFANKDIMKQDVCDADERCAPCIDPRNGKETGSCAESGVHEQDCVGGAGEEQATCCHRMGLCMPEDQMPEDARGNMMRDKCPAKHLCAPASQVEARPVKCDVLGASGVCLDLCFAEQLRGTAMLTRAGCGPTEVCTPCVFANLLGGSQKMLGCE